MTVQHVLKGAKLTRRFRDMDIKVMRVTPQSGGRPVPLNVEYDRAKNRVPVLYDMVLLPGDQVVVVENNNTALDNAINGALGSIGRGR